MKRKFFLTVGESIGRLTSNLEALPGVNKLCDGVALKARPFRFLCPLDYIHGCDIARRKYERSLVKPKRIVQNKKHASRFDDMMDSMKQPPNSPEFQKFTQAMRDILKVSKSELQRRAEAEKRKPKASASRASVASPRRAT